MNLSEYTNDNVINYHSKKHGVSIDETIDLFNQLKSFLHSCSVSSERSNPTIEVDSIWHSFILHTEEYALFCQLFFNKFIHHKPKNSGKDQPTFYADCSDVQKSHLQSLADCEAGGEAELTS